MAQQHAIDFDVAAVAGGDVRIRSGQLLQRLWAQIGVNVKIRYATAFGNNGLFSTFAETTGEEPPDIEIGKPAALLTARVDVRDHLDAKRAGMRAHVSQIPEDSWFLSLSDEWFARAFGTEWFIREGQGPGITETDLLAGLD